MRLRIHSVSTSTGSDRSCSSVMQRKASGPSSVAQAGSSTRLEKRTLAARTGGVWLRERRKTHRCVGRRIRCRRRTCPAAPTVSDCARLCGRCMGSPLARKTLVMCGKTQSSRLSSTSDGRSLSQPLQRPTAHREHVELGDRQRRLAGLPVVLAQKTASFDDDRSTLGQVCRIDNA